MYVDAVNQIKKEGLVDGTKSHKKTRKGIGSLTESEEKVRKEINLEAKRNKFFGWLNTLVHENGHVQGEIGERKPILREIKSFLQHKKRNAETETD